MSSYFGLDIGSTTIKCTKCNVTSTKSFTIEANGVAVNPTGSIDFTDTQVCQKLAPVIKQLLSEANIKEKKVVVSIAETKVFSRILTMPTMSDVELASAIKWEAEQFVPIPVSETELDYSIVQQNEGSIGDKKMLVYLVAAPKTYLNAMVDFLISLGLEPIALESEMVAISRSLTYGVATEASLILSIGAMSSVLAIVDGASLTFSYVSQSGGLAFTRALAQSLSLPLPQAEEYKRTYGLDPNQLEGKVRTGLLVILDELVGEMRKAIEYNLTTRKSKISRILLAGGGAYLPELSSYISETFGGIEVIVADPFGSGTPNKQVTLPKEKAIFGISTGLSQRIF